MALFFLKFLFFLGSINAIPFDDIIIPAQYINMNEGSSQCDSKILNSCQDKFSSDINSTSDIWNNPVNFNTALQTIYLKGISGLLEVCKARQHFQQCLGLQYDACMNVQFLMGFGLTLQNADYYLQTFREMEFDCDGGFLQISQNEQCIGTTWIFSRENFNDCLNDFNSEVAKDPSKICVASSKLQKCGETLFKHCGPEASWWQCERIRIGMNLKEFCAENVCQVSSTKQLASQERRKSIFHRRTARSEILKNIAKRKHL